ncbi:MAG: AAA family ATPase [Hyphomicrobiaceae bacterium]|nr:MAG: AAA family ATPase [Hyphomicrobiaceae bacterium]
MHINRLRLLGFKSFVEPTELVIEKGLTGVVGPNGCGKSNLLEALRWVMGETSHKSMRAAAMDDVIFSGTNTRPARNSAEVTIFIDNGERKAPAEFNDSETLEVTRRIEREAGSAYRINGKDVRARDVRILFEDAATGARSPALVRQGQISELVNAKPEQRRRILEDAAGIAGLHSRRHEAELRLRAAESNLARLNDILGQLGSQIESLKRQARQARRYKELSAEIRKGEVLVSHLRWTEAQAQVDAEEAHLAAALENVGRATEAEAKALVAEAEAAEKIQPLRDQEAAKGAVLHRFKVEQENLEREAERMAARQRELEARVEQLNRDLAREESLITEAKETLARLEAETESLANTTRLAADFEQKALAAFDEAEQALKASEGRLSQLTTATAEARARRQSMERQRGERQNQVAKIERQLIALDAQTREIIGRAPDASKLKAAAEAGQRLMAEIAEIELQAVAAEDAVQASAAEAHARSEAAAELGLAAGQLKTEVETLAKLLKSVDDSGLPPVLDQIKVAAGYEMALAAALGEDLEVPASEDAPVHWRLNAASGPDPALPPGTEPLTAHVAGPVELTRRLHQIGLVPRAEGARLQRLLTPGQRLVSREGDLWRWDGFVAAAQEATAAASRLAERSRLGVLASQEAESRYAADVARAAAEEAAARHRAAQAQERQLRQTWRETQARLAQTRDVLTEMERQARETETKIAAVSEAKTQLGDALVEAQQSLGEIELALDDLDGIETLESDLAAAHKQTSELRTRATESRTELITLEREHRSRLERQTAIAAERDRWKTRSAGAEQQIATLGERIAGTAEEIAKVADLPAMVEQQRQKLMSELAKAEQERQAAADQLAAADTAHRQAAQDLRAAQAAVSDEREVRARIEARLEGARNRRAEEARKIRDQLACAPDGCLALAEIAPDAKLPDLAEAESQLNRLKADRERLGGVNLQADEDLTSMTQQFDSMDKEKSDVEAAIAKLRSGISQINDEGLSRLQTAFDTVNGHFQRLFTTLFGGGEARLEMVEGEDPLESGLEIIAKPPGKKPATLSLLSGGEQSLTALALIFAVFLTNPSPICVLDEVDAPLDDANVDRFCTLMEKMAAETATRFLVITHHPMTMTRMNRLFGVTMGEKGVSQLVSVDLETAQKFTAAA